MIAGNTTAIVVTCSTFAAFFFVFRKIKSKNRVVEINPDENPVYATYEVHDDPVAEVGPTSD